MQSTFLPLTVLCTTVLHVYLPLSLSAACSTIAATREAVRVPRASRMHAAAAMPHEHLASRVRGSHFEAGNAML